MNNIDFSENLYVEITDRCNLRCKHCYNSSSSDNKTYIERSQFSFIVREVLANKIDMISLSGGEPTLNPHFKDIVSDICDAGIKCRIVTNGTTLSEKLIDEFALNDKIDFQLSLHGSTAITHNSLTSIDSFDRIVRTMAYLQKINKPYLIKTVINKYNISEIENIILFVKAYGAQRISVSFLQPFGRYHSNVDEVNVCSSDLIKYYKEVLQPLKKKYGEYLTAPDIQNTRCPLIFNDSNIKDKRYSVAPRIDCFGNVYICAMFVSRKFSIGNIFKSSFNEMFSSNSFYDLIKYMELREKYVDTCRDCAVNLVCGKGCPAAVIENDILAKNDYCDMMKWKIISDAFSKTSAK